MSLKLILGVVAVALNGCTHIVVSDHIPDRRRETIAKELSAQCASCTLGQCWQETSEVSVCKVAFSFATPWSKQSTLLEISKKLRTERLRVGFCAEDTTATHLVGAFFQGLGGGLASSSNGAIAVAQPTVSSSPINSNSIDNDIDTDFDIDQACSTSPTLP